MLEDGKKERMNGRKDFFIITISQVRVQNKIPEKHNNKKIVSLNYEEKQENNEVQNMTKIYENYLKASSNFIFSGIVDSERSALISNESNPEILRLKQAKLRHLKQATDFINSNNTRNTYKNEAMRYHHNNSVQRNNINELNEMNRNNLHFRSQANSPSRSIHISERIKFLAKPRQNQAVDEINLSKDLQSDGKGSSPFAKYLNNNQVSPHSTVRPKLKEIRRYKVLPSLPLLHSTQPSIQKSVVITEKKTSPQLMALKNIYSVDYSKS